MDITRRLRGIFRTAVVWATVWTIPGFLWIGALARRPDPNQPVRIGEFISTLLLNWTIVGAISGAAFALTLSIAERRKASLGELSMRRVTAWGAIGGAALPLILIPAFSSLPHPMRQLIGDIVVYGALGAASAAVSLSLARRASPVGSAADASGKFRSPAI